MGSPLLLDRLEGISAQCARRGPAESSSLLFQQGEGEEVHFTSTLHGACAVLINHMAAEYCFSTITFTSFCNSRSSDSVWWSGGAGSGIVSWKVFMVLARVQLDVPRQQGRVF